MEENQNKINIDGKQKEKEKKDKEKNEDKENYNFELHYDKYYKDKNIYKFWCSIIKQNTIKIIEQLNKYYEMRDWRNCTLLIQKTTLNKIFSLLNEEKRIELLNLLTKKILKQMYVYSASDINIIMQFLSSISENFYKNYKFDWKTFYSLFYIIDLFDKDDCKNYIKFYRRLHKFIPEDAITFEDYQIMRKTFLDDLINTKQLYAIHAFIYFFPIKFIREDDQLQLRMLYMIKNLKSNFIPCCCIFSKILKNNGNFFFSKDPKENDARIKTFIQYYFTYFNLYILNDPKVYNNNFISPYEGKSTNNKKYVFDKNISKILLFLLFNESLKEYNDYIEEHLNIILNNKHLYLKEKSRDSTTKIYICFLQQFFRNVYSFFHFKQYNNEIMKKIRYLKPYEENKYIYDRLLIILKYFSLNLEKIFLFDNEGSCLSQRGLFSLIASFEINDDYTKQVLLNINFDNYLKMLAFFKDYSETRMAKFIMKLYTIMPLLLNEYVFCNYPKVRDFLKESIMFLADNVSSANYNVDIDILIIFCYEFYRLKDLAAKNKIYEYLVPIVTEATLKIMNYLLRILDLICKKNYLDFKLFIMSMKRFLDKETSKQISLIYLNFIENNEIDSSNLEYYFFIMNEEEQISLFKYIYNNLLYVDSSNNIEINKHFLYDKKDKDFDIDITKCSIEIYSEKQLQGFQTIFSFMDYSKILTDKNMVKKFYELYYALTNQKDKKFQKLGNELFGFVLNSLIECNIIENNIVDGVNTPIIEYPSEKSVNIVIQMYEKLILPYEKFVIKYMENYYKDEQGKKDRDKEKEKEKDNNNESKDQDNKKVDKKNNIDIDKQTLERILGIYMKLIHKVSIAKCNIILNINFDDVNSKEYEIIKDQIEIYKKYKLYLNDTLNVIAKIFDYNKNDLDNKLFDSHLTNIYLNEIITLKLKSNSQKIESKKFWYKSLNQIIYGNKFIKRFKEFYMIHRTHLISYNHFVWTKLFIKKETIYYKYLELYLLNFNSVNRQSYFISICYTDFYSINAEKIKSLFNEIFKIFIEKLESLKADLLTEQNVMKNISESYNEFSVYYITLYPYDSLEVIQRLFKIIFILKNKKYRRLDVFISSILSQMKLILYLSKDIDPAKDKRFKKFSKKNEIIEEEINKLYEEVTQNYQEQNYLKQHNNNIRKLIEQSLIILFPSEEEENENNASDKSDKRDKNINQSEVILFFSLLIDYIKVALDKKDDLYRKVIQITFNSISQRKVPTPLKILWIKKLYFLLQEEYAFYQEYEWIIFKSKEEYMQTWNKLKYEKTGKESMISYPLERIRINKFKFDDYLNNNLKYDFHIETFLSSMGELDEWEEDQKLVKNAFKSLSSLDELVSKLVMSKFNEKKGLDFNKAKMFYYMFKLRYIDYNNDFVKDLNFTSELSSPEGIRIKKNCVIYEFLLGKYEYMFENHLFTEKDRNQLWEIMNRFTRRVDKVIDERIYAFFNYIFNNYALGDLEFIFNYDFYKYPIDLVADMYFLYHQDLPNLRCETKLFDNKKTEELLTKIFSTDENIILDINYLVYVLKMYYSTNGLLKYNYYYFISDYSDKLYEHFMSILEKSNTKHRRNALFTIYNYFFEYLNNNLPLLKAAIQKMALCINEFTGSDKLSRSDKGNKILRQIEVSFRSFTGNIHFPSLCDAIVDILKKENNSNDTSKILYLQVINFIYKGQKHLNLHKYTSQEIFDSLFKVFSTIKNEELKKNFSGVFLAYFNDLTEEENKKFIEKYEKYIFENISEEEEENRYNYIYILMNQLLRFKTRLPQYMQEFIIKLKIVNKNENDKIKKIIIHSLKRAMTYYHGSYIFMKENISPDCKEVLEEMTKEKTYFV